MAKVENLQRLIDLLQRRVALARQAGRESVVVGFTQSYAIYVHEDMEAYHKTGQAKFLEQPARTLSSDGTLAGIVRAAVRAGRTVGEGLLLAGLRLQREAQLLTPVLTGALRASAFTRKEG